MSEQNKADEARRGLIDAVKGKAKEVVGAITGNDSLTAEGQLEQTQAHERKEANTMEAVAEAQEPRLQELERIVDQVVTDVAKARERHVPAVLYFVYAGHGNVEAGRGYLALEDARLFGGDIERLVIDRVHAAETHIIVDACYSVFLAFSRGPGGERQEAHGFSTLAGLAGRADVGLLLSTSSARESHEWSEFQAGIFSHEVR